MTLREALTPEQIARNRAIRFRAIAESMDFVRSHLFAMEDAAINDLGQLYLNYYRELYQELVIMAERYGVGATWSASDAAFRERTEYLLAQITEDVKRLTNDAAAQTFEAMARAYSGGYYGAAWVIDNGLRTGAYANIPILPIEAIRTAMLLPYLGSTFLDRFADARDEFVRRIRRSIVESQIRGEGIDAAAMRLRQALGIGVGDPRGFFARVEMIARTEILRASNEGTLAIYEANQDVLKGYGWQASRDARVCPVCGTLDGQEWTWTQEHAVPPAHPMCLPGDSAVLASGVSATSERWYDGDVVIISTASGNHLTCTPNHPVLTSQGWIAADRLNEGGHVIGARLGEGVTLRGYGNSKNMPTRIEDVVKAFGRSGEMMSSPMPTAAEDFHGDGIGSQIAVIRANSLLRNSRNAPRFEHVGELGFRGGDIRQSSLLADSLLDFCFKGDGLTPSSIMGGVGLGLTFPCGHLRPLDQLGLASPAWSNTTLNKPQADSATADLESVREFLFRNAGEVFFDKIISIKRDSFHGFVYNLQTDEGWYIAQGIITHNCRCAIVPVLIDSDFEAAIVGPRQSYREWAAARGVSIVNDGGILRFRGKAAPQSDSAAAEQAAPHLYNN